MSGTIEACRSCFSRELESVLWLGFTPLVNDFRRVGAPLLPYANYPLEMLRCAKCELVQLGFSPPQKEIFGASYPYRSSVTRVLRDNFADLYREVTALLPLASEDLVIDIGGNDGNLLSNFTAHRTLNVTPEDMGRLGEASGISHLQRYWDRESAAETLSQYGKAKLVTATNVFAHVPDLHEFAEATLDVLADDGVFVVECHYLGDMIEGVQYDACYAEHQVVYSLASLTNLLAKHGLTVFRAHRIATHGGSIRVFAAKNVRWPIEPSFEEWGHDEGACSLNRLRAFAARAASAKRELWRTLSGIGPVAGIGAPSRAATLVSYTGIDHGAMPYVCETPESHKLGHYMPGTLIPVVDEARLYDEQPSHALLLSHHISGELIGALRAKGYRGKFVIPLPEPRVVS